MRGKRHFLAVLMVLLIAALGCSDDAPDGGSGAASESSGEDGAGSNGPAGTAGDAEDPGSDNTSTGSSNGDGSDGSGSTATTATTATTGGGSAGTPQPKRPPGWRVIAKAPIKGRHAHSAVWTGKEMIVWGGAERAGNAPIYLEDGAAYDPAADKWRTLPVSPLGARADHVAVWTGKEMLIWGGNPGIETPFGNNEFADGAAYNPDTDKWRPMAKFPLTARYATRAVWSGKVLVVWGGARAEDGEEAEPLADGAAYDPDRDSWSKLPPSPLGGRLSPLAAAVDGTVLISWGFNRDPGQALDGARYDPSAEAWAKVAPVPSTDAAWCFDLAGCIGVDTGTRVVFAGEGLVYDEQADRWAKVATSPLADPFLDGKALAFTGNRVVVFGGGRYTSDAEAPPEDVMRDPGMAYDPGADRWTPLPPAPIAARARTRGVWT
ncbi:MAG: Kelch repeat-containing protein, partial [Acidimicrobiia bacterium]